uniref:CCHC-type domain-containing protein n=1 Tax=Quercus lobata TaxID=97700 RepID=A0A7N2QWW4_QUELO
MGLIDSLWTWLNTSAVAGNGRSLIYLAAMSFHVFFFNREDAEKYVNDCYKVNAYKACYEPINGQNMWQSTGLPSVQPPIKRRPPGRPKKSRVKEPDEPTCHTKLRRVGVPKKCKACGRLGHNKRSCKGEGREGSPSGGPPTIEPNQTSAPPTTSEVEFPCAPPNSNATTFTPKEKQLLGFNKAKKKNNH